jgi:hypothetical protein
MPDDALKQLMLRLRRLRKQAGFEHRSKTHHDTQSMYISSSSH